MRPVIGVDIMGGDLSPLRIYQEIIQRLASYTRPLKILFFLTQDIYQQVILPSLPAHASIEIDFVIAATTIEMDDDPLVCVRKKKDSSLMMCIDYLLHHQTDAAISLGNTGALVAAAHLFGTKLPGIDRTALLAQLPTKSGSLTCIDVGANVVSTSDQLMQFADLGCAYLKATGKEKFKIGLINIGEEKIKGRQELRHVYDLLQTKYQCDDGIQFVGNIETLHIFSGDIDLLLSDGFTGNIVLKTAEGVSAFIFEQLFNMIHEPDIHHRLIKKFGRFFGYREHPGALLLGIDGIIMKCHGRSEGKQIYYSILECAKLVEDHFLSQLKTNIKKINDPLDK
ncbi:MAG: hypothetical protein HY860_06815 [Chlamydiales bacterium]|nr:hypothetical protein [Chlamydiales bacterium]